MQYQADEGMGYKPMAPDDSDNEIGFFRKVFGIVAAQLLYTAVICAFCMMSPTIIEFMMENVWLMLVFVILGVVSMCLPWCSKTLRRRVPHNYINLGVFVSAILDHMLRASRSVSLRGVPSGVGDCGRLADTADHHGVRDGRVPSH
jgi:hypothetical protein